MGFERQLQHSGWNAFKNKDPSTNSSWFLNSQWTHGGYGTANRPDRYRYHGASAKTLITAIFNRIAVDVASTTIEHVYVDENNRYLGPVDSGLNYCLTQEANIDQSGRDFIIDLVESTFGEGVVAAVPVDTTLNPDLTGGFDIRSLRVGPILQWYPQDVQVRLYDERDGQKHDIIVSKKYTAIIQNPFYSVMNEPNSTLRRLNDKIAKLDILDDDNASHKFNMILQMPYTIKTPRMREKSNERIASLEDQLANSKYGIGYIDGTEKVTQLNRPLDSNLVEEIDRLTKELFDQMGLTDAILNGSADSQTMKNYYVRIVDVMLDTITAEFKRKFLTKTARTQGQSIEYYRDPFTFMPTSEMADVGDKFIRNEILSKNEFRSSLGFKPNFDDPSADELSNPNIADVNQNPDSIVTEDVNSANLIPDEDEY